MTGLIKFAGLVLVYIGPLGLVLIASKFSAGHEIHYGRDWDLVAHSSVQYAVLVLILMMVTLGSAAVRISFRGIKTPSLDFFFMAEFVAVFIMTEVFSSDILFSLGCSLLITGSRFLVNFLSLIKLRSYFQVIFVTSVFVALWILVVLTKTLGSAPGVLEGAVFVVVAHRILLNSTAMSKIWRQG